MYIFRNAKRFSGSVFAMITLLAFYQTSQAVVIVGTDFTGRTVSGNTASNITWALDGIADPGDLTSIGGPGLFDTANAQGHFAPDRNVGNEGPWSTNIPLILTGSGGTVESVDLDWQHFTNTGAFQGPSRSVDWTATLSGSSSGVLATVTNANVSGTSGLETLTFSGPVSLTNAENYNLEIIAAGSNTTGNNTGLDAIAINGTSVSGPPPPPTYKDAVLASGAFAFFQLDESSGNTATNMGTVGAPLNGTHNNAGGFTFATPGLVPNGENLSLTGDGSTGGGGTEVRLPDNSQLNTAAFNNKSVSIWFNAPDIGTTRQVLYEQGGNTRGMNIYLEEVNGVDTLFMGAWNLAESNWPVTFAQIEVVEGQDHNAVFVLEGNPDGNAGTDDGSIFGYLDGNLLQVLGGAGQLRSHGDDAGIFGIHTNARFADGSTAGNGLNFMGTIDDLALWNIALSQQQVSDLFAAAQPAVPEPTTATLGLIGLAGLMVRRRRAA